MRNRLLYTTLRDFTEQAGYQLAADAAEGAEVPFELVESRGSRASLYAYRPLTEEFIGSRVGMLARLPAYAPAARSLEVLDGVPSYLAVRGEEHPPTSARDRAAAALRCFLSVVFDETTDFELSPARFERAYAELETALYEGRQVVTVLVPLEGLALVSHEVPIGEGLTLARTDAIADAPDDLTGTGDHAVAVLTIEREQRDMPPQAAAHKRIRLLLTALRLFDQGAFGVAGGAWVRRDAGRWRLHALSLAPAPPSDETLVLEPDVEDELRAFVNLIPRRLPGRGTVAWALRRFELGCERRRRLEALSDYLLAARALLEPEGASSGRLAGRLAAICAMPDNRAGMAERVAHAISLERAVIAGLDPAVPEPGTLVEELAGHLRALLRDVLCGHLEEDLVGVAEGLLHPEPAEPLEPEPEGEPDSEPEPEGEPDSEPDPEPDPDPESDPDPDPDLQPDTGQLAAFS
jgi:hypothetical protein